jgi:hypothetical protein
MRFFMLPRLDEICRTAVEVLPILAESSKLVWLSPWILYFIVPKRLLIFSTIKLKSFERSPISSFVLTLMLCVRSPSATVLRTPATLTIGFTILDVMIKVKKTPVISATMINTMIMRSDPLPKL